MSLLRERLAPLFKADSGWGPIPGGKKGGRRRRNGKGGWDYDYSQSKGDADELLSDYKLSIVGKDRAGALDVARKIAVGVHREADFCQIDPPACSDNLGIPRSEMPQLSGAAFKTFIANVKAKGIKVESTKAKVGNLKATQREIKAAKAVGMADSYLKGKFDKITDPILVSKDNYILDGHHRYAALLSIGDNREMNVLRVDMPVMEMLRESYRTPGMFRADVDGNPVKGPPPAWVKGGDVGVSKALTFGALAKGGEQAGHKYLSRKPDGKGGWQYEYGTGGNKPAKKRKPLSVGKLAKILHAAGLGMSAVGNTLKRNKVLTDREYTQARDVLYRADLAYRQRGQIPTGFVKTPLTPADLDRASESLDAYRVGKSLTWTRVVIKACASCAKGDGGAGCDGKCCNGSKNCNGCKSCQAKRAEQLGASRPNGAG